MADASVQADREGALPEAANQIRSQQPPLRQRCRTRHHHASTMITVTPTDGSNLKADYHLGYDWLISVVAAMGGLLFGAAGLAVIYFVMGWCYHSGVQGWPMLVLVLAAIGCYGMSLAPVTWVVISEIFPNRIRGAAMAVAVSSLWIACFLLTYTFPLLNARLGSAGTFWLYGAICVAGFVYIKLQIARNQGQDAGADRKRFGGLNRKATADKTYETSPLQNTGSHWRGILLRYHRGASDGNRLARCARSQDDAPGLGHAAGEPLHPRTAVVHRRAEVCARRRHARRQHLPARAERRHGALHRQRRSWTTPPADPARSCFRSSPTANRCSLPA